MPELPDVETWKRYVDATALHQKIAGIDVDAPRMLQGVKARQLKRRLEANPFSETRRHGKFLFVRAEGGDWLVLHFGMTGYLKYWKNADEEPDGARLTIRFANDYRLSGMWPRRLGRISLTTDPADFVGGARLGPDALASDLDADAFVGMFQGRRGSLKSALMDQKFIAGLGNVYSDEILFQAGLHPRASLSDLGQSELKQLYKAMHHVLKVAIDRQADPERMPGSWLLPQRRKEGSCPRCDGALDRIKIGGRTSYVCRACQKTGA